MSRPKNPIPLPRNHKGSAVIDVNSGGKRRTLTLGKWGSPEAAEEYERVLALLRLTPDAFAAGRDLTVNELLLAYLTWAESYYLDESGQTARSVENLKFTFRKLKELFGPMPAREFGPRALKSLREAWIADGIVRRMVNARAGSVRKMFRWAVSEELIPAEVLHKLQAVDGLRAGRSQAADCEPIRPAVMSDVEAVLPHLTPTVRALVLVQLHSGSRAGELVRMRVRDIDRSNPDAWSFAPAAHKGTWKGKSRTIYFGAKCREALAPLLLKAGGPDAYVFNPQHAEAERLAERADNRQTPRYPSHMKRNAAKRVGAKRTLPPGECYTTASYRRAIERACERAGVPAFSPHRLRHLAATRVRAELGVDAARALLGHSLAAVTEIYSHEVDRQLALKAVAKFG